MGRTKRWTGTGVWVGTLLGCVWGYTSCTPGELDDAQEKYLRNQVKKHYPVKVDVDAADDETDDSGVSPDDNNDSDVSPDDNDDSDVSPDTTDESTSEETSESTSTATTSATTSTGDESSEVPTSEPDAGGATPGEIPDCVLQMMSTTCSGSACHYGGAFNFPPNFEDESLFELLTTTGSSCSSATSSFYIDLENPEDSYLPQKVRGEGCGTPMPPPGEGEVSDAELECLEGWLESL